jgi:hypothetical protein
MEWIHACVLFAIAESRPALLFGVIFVAYYSTGDRQQATASHVEASK